MTRELPRPNLKGNAPVTSFTPRELPRPALKGNSAKAQTSTSGELARPKLKNRGGLPEDFASTYTTPQDVQKLAKTTRNINELDEFVRHPDTRRSAMSNNLITVEQLEFIAQNTPALTDAALDQAVRLYKQPVTVAILRHRWNVPE